LPHGVRLAKGSNAIAVIEPTPTNWR